MEDDVIGLLKVRVIRGIELVVRDTNSSDPHVVLTMGEQQVKSRIVKDSCNPEWNDELTLEVKDLNRAVMLEVYDNDTFTINDCMGDAMIDIRAYMKFVKMGEQELELASGTKIERILPDEKNDLAEESWIIWENGKFLQTMRLKLRDIEAGQVIVQIEWVPIAGRQIPNLLP